MAKILLVEESEQISEFLLRRLERQGHAVILARDGEAAVATAKATQPQLIILDLNLPVLDGWTAAQAIKADPQTANIPIIATIAESIAGDRDKAIQAGCDDFHPKPIDLTLLMQQIAALTQTFEPEFPPAEPSRQSQ